MANLPLKKWKIGALDGCIWQNKKEMDDGSEIEFRTVSFSRSFKKKGENLWRNEVVSLRKNDLPKAILILKKAQEYLFLEGGEDEREED